MGAPTEAVVAMIPTVLLPFNFIKATLNASIVLLLYKPLSNVLKRFGFLRTKESTSQDQPKTRHLVRSLIVTLVAVAIIVASLLVIFLILRK
jgi:hypothetical protein